LAIGLDASADSLAHAARLGLREHLPNLVLLREALERLPLAEIADEVTIHFPWGSLLRGALAEDESVFDAICRLPRNGGSLTLLLSLTERDGRLPLTDHDITRVVRAYRVVDYALIESRPIVPADIEAARSTWGKRLRVSAGRPGHLLRFERRSTRA
jgi:16S rRNA (adenine(1408)-N(1))-methyltransferase